MLKKKIQLRIKLGACDGYLFTEKGIPTITMGPAAFDKKGNKVLHVTDEYVDVDSLILWKDIYKNIVLHYANLHKG